MFPWDVPLCIWQKEKWEQLWQEVIAEQRLGDESLQQGLEPTWDKATLQRTMFSHLTFFSWFVCWLLWPLFGSQAPLVSRMVMMELRALFVPFVFRPLNYSCVGNNVSLLKVAASLAVNMAWELGRLYTSHRFADTGPRAKGARTRQDKRQFSPAVSCSKLYF